MLSEERALQVATALGRFLRSWAALTLAMPCGYAIAGLSYYVVGLVLLHGDAANSEILVFAAWWGLAAVMFCLTAGPLFLLLRRHLVRPTFPFLRPGFVVAALVGPAVYVAWLQQIEPGLLVSSLMAYEVPLLIGTAIYVMLARAWGVFGEDEYVPRRGESKVAAVARR
ncbi:hypothetical protein DJ021_14155 [Phenylobacterium hankyongense]|uniref:Uncharacterized protein n=1 Tax=Phenylobacterium hankyongense TaxID=1813876 RepID=A0A328B0E4_9CAUL|nr:hypothetical protein [Phenylobacterium hankyongense]RAK60872.1 hypothetical protein DJ021_14155 [Phenylobacterium hankyongense]